MGLKIRNWGSGFGLAADNHRQPANPLLPPRKIAAPGIAFRLKNCSEFPPFMPFDVFISYSQKDKAQAEEVCAKLEAADVQCWIAPRNIDPGADWAESIIAGIRASRVMVLIFSASANSSPQVRREVQRAFERGLTVMPFRIEDVQPSPALEYYMGSVHWLDALSGPMDRHIEKLASLVKVHRAAASQAPPATAAAAPEPVAAPNEVASVIRESRKELAEDTSLPLRISMQFNKAIVAGYSSTIAIRIENRSATPIENLDITLESNGLATSPCKAYRHLPPGHTTHDLLEIEAVKPGSFVLRCRVRFSQAESLYNLRGASQFTAAALGGQSATSGAEDFSTIPLELDYEVSQSAIDRMGAAADHGWNIPRQFLSSTQPGTKLVLEPAEGSTGFIRGIHLVARPEFKLGRSREEADFLTWFWPRSADHDAMTRRMSGVHVAGKLEGGKILIRDAESTNGSTFEGHPLGSDHREPDRPARDIDPGA